MRYKYPEDINELVAKHVFWEDEPVMERHAEGHIDPVFEHEDDCWYCLPDYYTGDNCEWHVINFAESMNYAWTIVQKMRMRDYLHFELYTNDSHNWTAGFGKLTQVEGSMPAQVFLAREQSAMLAICSASLLALDVLNPAYEVKRK